VNRRVAVGLAFAATLAFAPRVRADVASCVEQADKAQELRDAGQLVEAREKLVACSSTSCPGAVAKQCARWLQEVDQSMPSVVVRVHDAAGKDVLDASVSVDGEQRAPRVDGKPLVVNPGPHTILVRRDGAADAEEKIVVVAGEKNRVLTLASLPAPVEAPPPPPPSKPEPHRGGFTFPWYGGVLLGVGVAGFVGTAIVVPMARAQANDLRATCAPLCNPDDVDSVRTKITLGNVFLGVGIAGVTLGAVALVLANTVLEKKTPVSAFVAPLPGGAALGAVGRF
jgi:hypothetical protein